MLISVLPTSLVGWFEFILNWPVLDLTPDTLFSFLKFKISSAKKRKLFECNKLYNKRALTIKILNTVILNSSLLNIELSVIIYQK